MDTLNSPIILQQTLVCQKKAAMEFLVICASVQSWERGYFA